MIIDELNERFNELRAKKWRTVCYDNATLDNYINK